MRLVWRACVVCVCVDAAVAGAAAQGALTPPSALTWQDVRDRFRTTNPTLQAGRIGIDESRAAEVTAFLRPNPAWTLTLDQVGNTDAGNLFSASNLVTSVSYLHEREHKRELRRDSATAATAVATSTEADLERNLLFTLRSAFIQVLQAKAFRTLAGDNLANYDQVLSLGRDRLQAGDIAQIDLDRLQLQRVTYESDVQTAEVNLRTAKIQLLRLLNDQTTAVDRFDVTGPFAFAPPAQSLEDLRRTALEARPDLRAASQAIDKARTDFRLAFANGSVDPTVTVDAGFPALSQAYQSYQPALREYVGVSVGVPLRLFDRNQGEKVRTQLDVARNERLADAARLQVFGDVDTAYATVVSAVTLLQPYRDRYLEQATRVRDTVTFSYQRGAVSLVDFLQAQQEYRAVQVSYVNLVAAFLNAVNQLNLAVGREVIP
ncbi:MAG TPA: TolC family protein [Vicinamibacterales bacterium]|nr:TolC family protein [Vicinamibacterales bacterium]